MSKKPLLRVGLIGTGFMGKAHVFGFASAQKVFDLPYRLEMHTVADITEEAAARAAADFGFIHASADWRTLVSNPEIDLIDITAPNALHKELQPSKELGVIVGTALVRPLETATTPAGREATKAADVAAVRELSGALHG